MKTPDNLLQNLEHLSAPQLRRLLTERLTTAQLRHLARQHLTE